MSRLQKSGMVNFSFIARSLPTILAAGGILCILINENAWSAVLLVLAATTFFAS